MVLSMSVEFPRTVKLFRAPVPLALQQAIELRDDVAAFLTQFAARELGLLYVLTSCSSRHTKTDQSSDII